MRHACAFPSIPARMATTCWARWGFRGMFSSGGLLSTDEQCTQPAYSAIWIKHLCPAVDALACICAIDAPFRCPNCLQTRISYRSKMPSSTKRLPGLSLATLNHLLRSKQSMLLAARFSLPRSWSWKKRMQTCGVHGETVRWASEARAF